MTPSKPLITRGAVFWAVMGAFFLGLLMVLSDVLLPFVVGITIAYLLNPVCDALAARGTNRTVATFLILLIFVLSVVLLLLLVGPIVIEQIRQLALALPGYIESARTFIEPQMQRLMNSLTPEQTQKMQEVAQQYAGEVASVVGTSVTSLLKGSQAIINFFSVIIITPIVAFYLLRDWHKFVGKVDSWLPRAYAPTIREQVREIDRTLAGFVRGQAIVCFMLGTYYSVALSLAGISYGFVVGLLAGLLSFIPFVGSTFGLVVSTALALLQYDGYTQAAIVVGIFMVAQFFEGNVITPKFVGESVGLHPVWIIFALMAGGSLMGFTGMLLALPVAAVIGVLTRFALSRYMKSAYYNAQNRPPRRRVHPL